MEDTTSRVSGPHHLQRVTALVSMLAVLLLASCGGADAPGSSGGGQPADSPADVGPGETTIAPADVPADGAPGETTLAQ